MVKLASHNSLTYLPCNKWYMIPFKFMARCQRKTIKEQYEKYSIRMFDIRVSFNKDKVPYICHGLINYKGNIYDILEYLNSKKDSKVRIILEKIDNAISIALFCHFCKEIIKGFPNIKFFGGVYKKTWVPIYKFKYSPRYDDKYASNNTKDKKSGVLIDDLWPYVYAKLNNRKNIKRGTDKPWLFIDFVDIR